jgi:CRP-like cAMP-binding protein
MKWRNAEMNIYEPEQRSEIIEVLESVSLSKTGALVLPLLKEDSWENCAKIGETYFDLKKSQSTIGIVHFLKSENRLTLLSALYVLDRNPEFYYRKKVVEELLYMMTKNNNSMVSDAATDLLRRKSGSRIPRSRAFELMEGVLLLKKVLLFHGISADKLLRLMEVAHLVEFEKGDVVSTEGRVSDQIYIVKSGILRIEKRINGARKKVAMVAQGESYGEEGLFSRSIRATAAIANTGTKVYIIKGSDIKRLVREMPDIGFNLLEVISTRLLRRGEEVEKLKGDVAMIKS